MFVLFSLSLHAQSNSEINLTLKEAEKKALETSHDLKSMEQIILSISEQAEALNSKKFPQFNLEANYKYLETVPKVKVGLNEISLGDNSNYSFGPTISYNVWDGGQLKNAQLSLQLKRDSKISEEIYLKDSILLAVRLAYLKTIIKTEELKLMRDNLGLSKLQNSDIQRKNKYGASSKLELTISNREVYNFELQVSKKESELQEAELDLAFLTNTSEYWLNNKQSKFKLEKLDNMMSQLEAEKINSPSNATPQVKSLELLALSYTKEAQSISSNYWPQFSIKAKSSIDYPNGPTQESFNQNTISVNLTMPIFDWGYIKRERNSKVALAKATSSKTQKLKLEIDNSWRKQMVLLKALRQQKHFASKLSKEAKEVANINLNSYKSGKIQFNDVEMAKVREIEAKLQELAIEAKIFTTIASLKALSGEE